MKRTQIEQIEFKGHYPRDFDEDPFRCSKCGSYCLPGEMNNVGAVEKGLCDKHFVENFGTFCDVCESEI